MLEELDERSGQVVAVLWSTPMIVLVLAVGFYFTIRLAVRRCAASGTWSAT